MELLQVRFHPLHPEILASGSLDHEVRLWNAKTAECIGSRNFCTPLQLLFFLFLCDFEVLFLYFFLIYACLLAPFFTLAVRPIASLAFHAEGEVLAVACGHKVLNTAY